MTKEQKLTPFKYACQVYAKDIEYCPAEKDRDYECENWDGHVKYETCADCIEHYIKERATVPDGWGVVLDIYEIVNSRIDRLLTIKSLNTYMVPKKTLKEIGEIKSFIKVKLKEAGIEVE